LKLSYQAPFESLEGPNFMTTSNLLNAASGCVQLALGETDPTHRGKAIVGSMILLCFAGGALLGGVCTLQLPAYPLLPVVVLAAAGMPLTMRERRSSLKTRLAPD